MRAKGQRGQDLQGTVEIQRDLRHLWPVRPSDALLHSKSTCPARSRRRRPVAPPTPSAPAFSAPPTGGSGYNITTGAYGYGGGDGSCGGGAYGYGGGDGPYGGGAYGYGYGNVSYGNGPYGGGAYGYGYGNVSYGGDAYGYGGSNGGYSDGAYSGGPYDHGGHGDANYEAVPGGQSPGGGAGHDIPPRPPGAYDDGYHRAMQQAGNGGNGAAFAAEDGGHEDEGYFGGPFSSVFGGPEPGHSPTTYVLQLPTSGRSSGTGCDISRSRRSTAVVITATVPIGVRSSSTAAVVVVIVRNRSCNTTAAATVQHCGRSSRTPLASSVALAGSRRALAAVDRR